MSSHISIQDISVRLNHRLLLDHVSFSMEKPGHLLALLGPNGSGKTTLLRAICGEIPHEGTFSLNGTDLSRLRPKSLAKAVSYIPQQSGISISMRVIDVVLMGYYSRLSLLSQPSADMRAAAEDALSRVGILNLSDRDYMTLSGGEKQLVILARTLVEDTKLLLFDEPDSSLDPGNKYKMLHMISSITSDAEKTALICLHDPVLALTFCDTLLLLKNGRLIHTLHPVSDPVFKMEAAFSELYGETRLIQVPDPQKSGQMRFVLLPLL